MQANCNVLQGLGDVFWSASVMAEMGRSTLEELDKIFSNAGVVKERQQMITADRYGDQDESLPVAENRQAIPAEGTLTVNPLQLFLTDSAESLVRSTSDNDFVLGTDTQFDLDSIFNKDSNYDLWGLFDPSFNLDGLDASMDGNSDLALPTCLP